jgi:hypothetical protein
MRLRVDDQFGNSIPGINIMEKITIIETFDIFPALTRVQTKTIVTDPSGHVSDTWGADFTSDKGFMAARQVIVAGKNWEAEYRSSYLTAAGGFVGPLKATFK